MAALLAAKFGERVGFCISPVMEIVPDPRLPALDGIRTLIFTSANGVAAYVAADPRFAAFSEKVADLAQLLLPAYEAEGKAYFRLGGVEHSTDHAWLAWASDETGGELFTVHLRDLATGTQLLRGSVDGFSGFSLTGSTSATAAAERDARARLAVVLADKMVTQLIAASTRLPA